MQTLLGHIERWLAYSQAPLEDCAGEKEVRYKKKKNLNDSPYWESAYGKKQPYKAHGVFHFRGEIKIVGNRDDMYKCKECDRLLFSTAFTTSYIRSDSAFHLKTTCRECCTELEREKREARKNAPPKSEVCDCCHKNKKLQMDHTHGTTNVRGWLCANCNSGIGGLRDNLEGVLQAAIYLEKNTDKIIETLNGIKKGAK